MKKTILIALLATLLTACATGGRYSGSSYSGGESRRIETIRMGTITALAPVNIQDKASGLGAIGGAIAGGVVGSTMGAGHGNTLMTLGGAILGAAAGGAIENATNQHNAIRISLRLDNNEHIAVTQELDANAQALRIGDRVQLFSSGGTVRVAR